MKKVFVTAALGMILTAGTAQDIHFARAKDMQKWYNASSRAENNEGTITLNYRNVTYKSLIAFKSVAALVEVPLISKANRVSMDKSGYFSIGGGFAVDKSNQGILRNTMPQLGVSYHLPVNVNRTTYISMGVQGSYFESRINMTGVSTPDQFDSHGMIPNSSPNDPGMGGKINFFSLNAGLSLSHTADKNTWYVGASARHLNRPEASMQKTGDFKLPVTAGFQGGVQKISGDNAYGVDMMLNFKANAYEHLATAFYKHSFRDNAFDGNIGASLGYRYNDAIIPGIQLQIQKTVIGFNYDMIMGNKKNSINRVSYELGLKQIF
jgi:type IX secretion system PorP/SprF family membrane protein